MRRSNTPTEVKSFNFKQLYLLGYNLLQTVGWSYVAVISIWHLTRKPQADLYDTVHCSLTFFQTLALLEIVHAATGLVKSNPIVTAFQVFSRVFLLWGVTNLVLESQKQIGFAMLLSAWIVTEIIRYSFYMGSILNRLPYFITYARYTFFIALYPIGVTGELLTIYKALSPVKNSNILTYSLPNPLNISFSYYSFLILVMLTYIPVFPRLYMHMFSQRRKVLKVEPEKKFN